MPIWFIMQPCVKFQSHPESEGEKKTLMEMKVWVYWLTLISDGRNKTEHIRFHEPDPNCRYEKLSSACHSFSHWFVFITRLCVCVSGRTGSDNFCLVQMLFGKFFFFFFLHWGTNVAESSGSSLEVDSSASLEFYMCHDVISCCSWLR